MRLLEQMREDHAMIVVATVEHFAVFIRLTQCRVILTAVFIELSGLNPHHRARTLLLTSGVY